MKILNKTYGFSYIEVLVSLFIVSIAITPAMQAMQSGIKASAVHNSLTHQYYALITCMETVQAKSYLTLLNAAEITGNTNTPSDQFFDNCQQSEHILVFLSLYDADNSPFILNDPNTDNDNNLYTGSTSDLLWLQVKVKNGIQSMETLISR